MKNKKTNRVLIGYVGIDTGTLALGDPVYLAKVMEAAAEHEDLYTAVKDDTTTVKNAIFGALVETGLGDGFYPVYVTTEDLGEHAGTRVVKVEIEFMPGN